MPQRLQYAHFEIQTDAGGSPARLGAGGMGTTYKALDTHLRKFVVLKVINDNLLHDPKIRRRFYNEARAAARVDHPHVAKVVYCCPDDAEECFFAMEFINGETLYNQVKRRSRFPAEESLILLRGVVDALGALSDEGLIHRDIKPQNIMIETTRRGPRAKLIDFGLVKVLDDQSDLHQSISGESFLGSIYFASPEQVNRKQGVNLDARTDFYSLGVTLWHSLTGEPPFMGTQLEVMEGHVYNDPPWQNLGNTPDAVHTLLRSLLAKNRDERPANADALLHAWDQTIERLKHASSASRPEVMVSLSGTTALTLARSKAESSGAPSSQVPWIPQSPEIPDTSAVPSSSAIPEVSILATFAETPPALAQSTPLPPPESHPDSEIENEPSTAAAAPLSPLTLVPCPAGHIGPEPAALATRDADGRWLAAWTIPIHLPAKLRKRWESEVQSAMHCRHPGILGVLEITTDRVVTEWEPGVSAAQILDAHGGALPPAVLRAWAPGISSAADFALRAGLQHLDLSIERWLIVFEDLHRWETPAQRGRGDIDSWGGHTIHLDPMGGWSYELGAYVPRAMRPLYPEPKLPACRDFRNALGDLARSYYRILGGDKRSTKPLRKIGPVANRLLHRALHKRDANGHTTLASWSAAFTAAFSAEARPSPASQSKPKQKGKLDLSWVFGIALGALMAFAPYTLPALGISLSGIAGLKDKLKLPTPTPARLGRKENKVIGSWSHGNVGETRKLNIGGGQEISLAWIPPGTFLMGSREGEKDRSSDEGPVQTTISKGFWIAQTEITQGQWMAVMQSYPGAVLADALPVENISWENAREFVTQLNNLLALEDGWRLDFPTEAQWEYACRADTTTAYAFGQSMNGATANCDGSHPYGTDVRGPNRKSSAPVRSYQPNPWGIYDMHGNVWEWCRDEYDAQLSGGTDPYRPGVGGRVLRGGSWTNSARICRSAARFRCEPGYHEFVGFRVVLVPEAL